MWRLNKMYDLKEREKKKQEEFNTKFEKAPESIQKDVLYLEYQAKKSQENMNRKMVYGKKIPDDLLDDIKTYFDNYNAIFNLLEINPLGWNVLEE